MQLLTLNMNFTAQINEDTGTVRTIQRKLGTGTSTASSSTATRNTSSKEKEKDAKNKVGEDEVDGTVDERATVFNDVDSKIGKDIVQSLVAIVFDVYYSSVGPAVKHKCLTCLLKMLYHSPRELLEDVLVKIPISSFIAGMLASSDLRTVCSALQKADILMAKMTNTFHVYFRREGVMHRIKSLAEKPEGGSTAEGGSKAMGVGSSNSSSPEASKHNQAVSSNRGTSSVSPSQDRIEVGSSSTISK